MKLQFRHQVLICIAVILLANVLTTVFGHWLFRSVGFGLCGLLYLLHPVLPAEVEENAASLRWARIAGVIMILLGVFTRAYL